MGITHNPGNAIFEAHRTGLDRLPLDCQAGVTTGEDVVFCRPPCRCPTDCDIHDGLVGRVLNRSRGFCAPAPKRDGLFMHDGDQPLQGPLPAVPAPPSLRLRGAPFPHVCMFPCFHVSKFMLASVSGPTRDCPTAILLPSSGGGLGASDVGSAFAVKCQPPCFSRLFGEREGNAALRRGL